MLAEPGVLDRGVAGDQVEQDAKAAFVRRGDELVEVVERTELGVDSCVVRNVVAEVREGGGVDRRQPEGVDSEPDEVVEALRDSAQVADPVSVGVLERTRVDLVDDSMVPPAHGRRGYDPRTGPGPCPRTRSRGKTQR